MAQILVRNVDEAVKRELQRRATEHGRSLEAEVRDILRAVANAPPPADGLGSEIVRLVRESGECFPKLQELRGARPEEPDFAGPTRDPHGNA